MRDIGEYLRAYRTYVSASHGWAKAIMLALAWIAGMFVPLAARTFVELPNWLAITWMVSWALLGYILRLTECGNITALKAPTRASAIGNGSGAS
jgi:hypothetical protein